MENVEHSSDIRLKENNEISCNESRDIVHPFLRKLQALNRQRIKMGFDQEDIVTYTQVKNQGLRAFNADLDLRSCIFKNS